jgi:hypothetical protein
VQTYVDYVSVSLTRVRLDLMRDLLSVHCKLVSSLVKVFTLNFNLSFIELKHLKHLRTGETQH